MHGTQGEEPREACALRFHMDLHNKFLDDWLEQRWQKVQANRATEKERCLAQKSIWIMGKCKERSCKRWRTLSSSGAKRKSVGSPGPNAGVCRWGEGVSLWGHG